ncbi:hypothetical protein [uncultured Jatrophihabitans sp.]|uniref:hypothetical protein n=1 Tax=uncultured Jatrophihabitans sp. TaxID=1610747 RepID=UPI0035CC1092
MRWDELFADLEAQASALARAERGGEVDERTRGEVGTLALLDRLRAALGAPVRLHVLGGLTLAGAVSRVGPDWLLVDEQDGREAVVVLARVLRVRGLARYSAVPDSMSVVESRLGLRHVLRGIARDRSATRVHLVDGTVLDATLDRIGADFVEVAMHAPGEARRRHEVREVEAVPLSAVAVVRRGV